MRNRVLALVTVLALSALFIFPAAASAQITLWTQYPSVTVNAGDRVTFPLWIKNSSSASRTVQLEVVEVPDEEFESQGPNVLALGPRHALALDGNPETRRRMERAGVDVVVYRGEEISRKGDGGPTCLTRPLLRT